MKRNAISDLINWKNSADRKPLVMRGARQVGKTWLMREFGQSCYSGFVYFNFDEEDELKSIFETNKNPQRIVELLSLIAGEKILPGETLIIFDEIQECPEALNSLKYFKEKANEYHVIAAGSLLAQPKSYPVGMVNLLDLYPLTFDEFLEATDEALYAYYESIHKDQQIEEIFHNRLLEAYNNYLIIGGMPECVASWVKEKDPAKISQIQRELIEIYENDFSKHNGKVNSGRILMVFRSIVSQLAKSNEKFIYGAVRQGGRARDFEKAIEWLVSAGILNRIYNVSKMEHPLSAFDKLDQFKLFLFDTGLLKHMAGIDNSAILLITNSRGRSRRTTSCSSSEDNLQWNHDTILTKTERSTSFCSMGWTSFLSRQRAARKNPPRPLSGTSLSVTPNMPSAFRREGTARTEPLPIFRCTWSEKQESCYNQKLDRYRKRPSTVALHP